MPYLTPDVTTRIFRRLWQCPTLAPVVHTDITLVDNIKGTTYWAAVSFDPPRIYLDKSMHENEADVIHSLAHELCHLLLQHGRHTVQFQRKLGCVVSEYLCTSYPPSSWAHLRVAEHDHLITQVLHEHLDEPPTWSRTRLRRVTPT